MKEVRDVPFETITTFGVGGTAARVCYPTSSDEVVDTLRSLQEEGVPYTILGGGSNVLPPDGVYERTIVVPHIASIAFNNDGSVVVGAGYSWDAFVAACVERGLWGVENLSGIPGSVGAAPIQNIGAYGSEVSHTLTSVTVYDTEDDEVRTLSNDALQFGYRTSLLKKERGKYVVLDVSFMLSKNPQPLLSYKDVAAYFGDTHTPTLSEIRDAILSIRSGKFPDISQYGTAGSFFMNPILPKEEGEELLRRFPDAVHYVQEDGIKFSLAWLLDHALHIKGMTHGSAMVWHAQPLVLVSQRGARAHDVHELASLIEKKVRDEIGIVLTREVQTLL